MLNAIINTLRESSDREVVAAQTILKTIIFRKRTELNNIYVESTFL